MASNFEPLPEVEPMSRKPLHARVELKRIALLLSSVVDEPVNQSLAVALRAI